MFQSDANIKADQELEKLVDQAKDLGASRAALIPTERIRLDDGLAETCQKSPCPAFGLAPSCPPHSGGPDAFRRYAEDCPRALLISLDVPTSILLSSAKTEAFATLHHISSALEREARALGLTRGMAFAGGSCKTIFCSGEKNCAVLAGRGPCPYEDQARPSLSGFGVDVSGMFKAAGWEMKWAACRKEAIPDDTAPLVGLVLLG